MALQSLNANHMNLEWWVRVLRRDEDEDQFKQNIWIRKFKRLSNISVCDRERARERDTHTVSLSIHLTVST